ncbi:class I SAM-dependent methyltransferase [uncultured Paludibaculum sp.]|uniref:class I SAM-dependent methyltransferase n=1 Tax=uncultured Paludibaculum sp. TaxID=1765020 RepID=UPI002AAC0894|nr:class I SAM-dependent methyltransferase [uncultured Paludibaculum sp.]
MKIESSQALHLSPVHPAAHADATKQPGHWLLASLGKRVLRPGGLELTRQLIEHLATGSSDDVVEFAPGLGATARLTLSKRPRSYVGVERDQAVARQLQTELGSPNVRIVSASAESTQLAANSASIVYGEAMLSMQTPEQKCRILAEAYRILKPGGRYGIHELALLPDNIDEAPRKVIEREMSMNIHVGVRPATLAEWRHLLGQAGFQLEWQTLAPMHLLEPKRMLDDEGIAGVLRIAFNLLRRPAARRRVLSMRRMFSRHAIHLGAVAIVCAKPAR